MVIVEKSMQQVILKALWTCYGCCLAMVSQAYYRFDKCYFLLISRKSSKQAITGPKRRSLREILCLCFPSASGINARHLVLQLNSSERI